MCIRDRPGIVLGQKYTPIEKAGVYVPGGTAAYPSTCLLYTSQAEWKIIAVLFTKLSFVFSCDFPIFDGFSQNPLHRCV